MFRSKTVEGTVLQLVSAGGKTNSIVVSTLVEAWKVVDGGLVSDGIVKDVCLVLSVVLLRKFEELCSDSLRVTDISQQAG